jgi:hypothetical protein
MNGLMAPGSDGGNTMSGMKDYMKGEQEGYSTGPKGMPKSFSEAMGQSAGEARRRQEMQRSGGGGGGPEYVGGGVSGRTLLILAVIPLALLMLLIPFAVVYPITAVVGLVMTGRVRRVLGIATPIYVGALVGMLLGSIELALSSSQLNLYNLMIFIFAGAMLGAIAVPFALLRKK